MYYQLSLFGMNQEDVTKERCIGFDESFNEQKDIDRCGELEANFSPKQAEEGGIRMICLGWDYPLD